MNKSAFQTIMPVKPGTISDSDKATLKEIGVVVIEHDAPETLRLITPMNETDHGAMLVAATKALQSKQDSPVACAMREYFARLVMEKFQKDVGHE